MTDYGTEATTEEPPMEKEPFDGVAEEGNFNTGVGKPLSEYQHGLCDCFSNWKNCCLVFFCMPIAACMASHRLAENFCYPMCFGAIPLSVRFRSVAHIEEDMCIEGCKWACFPMCSLCRLLNEMDTRSFAMVVERS